MSDTTLPGGEGPPPPLDDPEGPFRTGARVGGRYTIEEKIGVGGMGVVYRARQDLTDKQVALKVLRASGADDLLINRFLDEIRLLGRLEHHGLAAIHDADVHARPGAAIFPSSRWSLSTACPSPRGRSRSTSTVGRASPS